MVANTKPDDSGIPSHSEHYVPGYHSDITLKLHTTRSASKQAAWFLPLLKPGMTLLDCGCATGSITVGLAEAVNPGQVTGIDISEIEIERAKARAADAEMTNIAFAVGDIYRLDFADNSFDAVFSHNVLEHTNEPNKALREMYRVLKPGGIIGIRDADMGGFLISPTDERLEQSLALYESDWNNVNGHPRLARHLSQHLSEAGFVNVETSASYDTYASPEGRELIGQVIASRFAEADFLNRVTSRRLATSKELIAIKQAWLNWAELADGLFAASHCEAMGRKA